MKKGRLVVIDGGDGSGKTTQAKLLTDYLRQKGQKVKYIDFPNYTTFFGKLVGRFLAGDFGKLDDVSPYLAALPYALDRASIRDEIKKNLRSGKIIISNRYTTSSIAHQTAKMAKNKREEFSSWLEELEYKQLGMPKPDLVIYLYVPWKVGQKLTAKKAKNRRYVKGQDIAEKNIKHRIESEKMYLKLAKRQGWVKIDCVNKYGKIMPPDKIHELVVEAMKI